jgi:hypothetical protein
MVSTFQQVKGVTRSKTAASWRNIYLTSKSADELQEAIALNQAKNYILEVGKYQSEKLVRCNARQIQSSSSLPHVNSFVTNCIRTQVRRYLPCQFVYILAICRKKS